MLIRHDPWDLLSELSHFLENTQKRPRDDSKVESSQWIPAVDIKEEPDQFKLYVDIPGVDPKNIEVFMENDVLTIKGTREETKEEEKNNYHRIERVKGVFYRRFTLPETAGTEQIHAKTKQGVLEITIGKKKTTPSRKIEIKTEE
jgi:HSP20 family protein